MTLATSDIGRRAVRLGVFTIGYNVAEGVAAVTAGLMAGSVALTGFGFDSGIEVIAAIVVVRHLRAELASTDADDNAERRALRIVAMTFFALAVYVLVEGTRDLATSARPASSPAGIAITAASVVIMPLLARSKRRVGQQLGSNLVVADANETRLCALLSASTLTGLVVYQVTGWSWIDAVAGFVIAVFAITEGREAWEGELVCNDHEDHEHR